MVLKASESNRRVNWSLIYQNDALVRSGKLFEESDLLVTTNIAKLELLGLILDPNSKKSWKVCACWIKLPQIVSCRPKKSRSRDRNSLICMAGDARINILCFFWPSAPSKRLNCPGIFPLQWKLGILISSTGIYLPKFADIMRIFEALMLT